MHIFAQTVLADLEEIAHAQTITAHAHSSLHMIATCGDQEQVEDKLCCNFVSFAVGIGQSVGFFHKCAPISKYILQGF